MAGTTNDLERSTLGDIAWMAGATGAAVAIAALAYSRRKPTYWERAKRGIGQFAETSSEQYRRASASASKAVARTGKQVRPWIGTVASTALALMAAVNSRKPRHRRLNAIRNSAATAGDRFTDAVFRLGRSVPQYLR